jgi:hypothetical protein
VLLETELIWVLDFLQVVQSEPQTRSSIQEAPVSPLSEVPPQSAAPEPQSPVMPRSSVPDIPVESHMVLTQPTAEEVELNNAEDTGYSAIALYDYQAGWISPDFLNMGTVTKFHTDDMTPCHWLNAYQSPHLVTQCHIPEDLNPQKQLSEPHMSRIPCCLVIDIKI